MPWEKEERSRTRHSHAEGGGWSFWLFVWVATMGKGKLATRKQTSKVATPISNIASSFGTE